MPDPYDPPGLNGMETHDITIYSRPRGGTPYNGLYGEAPPERGTLFRLQVYKRVGISRGLGI